MARISYALKELRNLIGGHIPELLIAVEMLGVGAVGYFSAKGALEAN